MEKSAGDEHDVATSPAAEVESPCQQPSLHLMHCDDEALASAENENNLNVESENSGNTDRLVEAAGPSDVLAAAENSEDVVQDSPAYMEMAGDETAVTGNSGVSELSAGADSEVCETSSRTDRAVLSSCSEMVIDVQDHEFSDEEVEDVRESGNDSCEPAVVPLSNKSSVEQHKLQQSVDSKPVTVEQGQKSQPATRIIRLNRNFSQPLSQSFDVPECQATSGSKPSHKVSQKPAAVSKRPSNEASFEQATLTIVRRSSDSELVRSKQLKVDNSSKRPQATQKVSVQKTVAGTSRTRKRSGEMSAVKVQSKLSPDSGAVTSSKPQPDEYVSAGRSQQGAVRPRNQRGDSAESDSLSKTQLEILELEMRARAIKAMIRAQEEMEQRELVEKKRRSSAAMDSHEPSKKPMHVPQHSLPQSSPSVRQPSSSTSRYRGELRSLQSVVGRNIIKRAEFVARHQRRVATQQQYQQRKQFVEQRRLSQAALMASRRTVKLQPETRMRPVRYIVTSEPGPRVIRLPSAHFSMPLPFSRRQRQRHVELHRNVPSSDTGRGDKRRVLLSSSQRSIRLSASSSRPYY